MQGKKIMRNVNDLSVRGEEFPKIAKAMKERFDGRGELPPSIPSGIDYFISLSKRKIIKKQNAF